MGASIVSEEKRLEKKYINSTSMNGNLMMKMVVTEDNAFIKQGPKKMDLPEIFHNDLKNSLGIFAELSLIDNPNLKFVGKEIFEDTEVYAIEINGEMMSSKFLYDVNSGLKIKEIAVTNMGGQPQTQESIIGNYKDYLSYFIFSILSLF